jgi:hypothetical protein
VHHPGHTTFVISTTPYAAVSIRVTRRGRAVYRARRSGNKTGQSRGVFRWNCHRSGQHRWRVIARDGYGGKRNKSGFLRVPTCAEVAARHQTRLLRRRTQCQGYSPCLQPRREVDCRGGGGDGPCYVDGPVDVYGSDPYGLDSDGDDIGCES